MPRFKTVSGEKKEEIRGKRKAPNTNRATKLWIQCFREYLTEKNLKAIDDIETKDLPGILEQFYSEVRKKEKRENQESAKPDAEDERNYKNTTLKAIRGALARHFKETRSIDIISNEAFIKANQIFEGVQKINKELGLGSIKSKPPIEHADLLKLGTYFKACMEGPPNPKALQEIVMFYLIFYLCRRGRENLRPMKKMTFSIEIDPEDGRKYLFQAIDEADKNHRHDDTSYANQGRIYEVPGTVH